MEHPEEIETSQGTFEIVPAEQPAATPTEPTATANDQPDAEASSPSGGASLEAGVPVGQAAETISATQLMSKKTTTIKIPSMMLSSGEASPTGSASAVASAPVSAPATTGTIPPLVLPNSSTLQSPVSPTMGPMSGPASAGPTAVPMPPSQATVMGGQPQANQNRASAPAQQSGSHPQLNDALAYLDRVKAEFHDQPDVYNKFLQIMRDFKVNAYDRIDSNGVIYRLVHLFMGHKSLIEGFNAFLPKTHHIDPMVAETGILPPHIIQAAVHSGLAAMHPPHPQMLGNKPHPGIPMMAPPQQPQSAGQAAPATINLSHFVAPSNLPVAPAGWGVEAHPGYGGYQRTAPAAPSAPIEPAKPAALPVVQQAVPAEKKASPQFNKAFGYVKKIKNRFNNDPETYKAFLAALHSYHKEQLSIHEVYEQVSLLFRDNPDLLAEFMQFLPEQDAAAIITRTSSKADSVSGALGRYGDIELRSRRGGAGAASKAVKRAKQATALLSSYPATAGYVAQHRSPEETEFFDKVKAYLGSKAVYAEFLKCLNLFSQDILKLDDLLRLVNGFIGGSDELYGWFKRYIGLKESQTVAGGSAEGPVSWRGTAAGITAEIPELNLNACKRIGSYRIYPKTHKLVKASGRTALCEEILNDQMISCPTFTSEDSTFIASRKNQYEEALFKCEDERFELDLLIEHNLATIAVFEPLVKRIDAMEADEKANLTLGPTLGGSSEVIYRKALRKIYGDKCEEIIQGIRRSPATALPIVLQRLKQKDEEWRRLQRDWNKIWRDVHLKNYYKALDHQGIEFKALDKRNFAVKTLLGELESIASASPTTSPKDKKLVAMNHLEFVLNETDKLLEDLVKLIKVHLRCASGLSSTDRKAVLEFFSSFVPEFFAWKGAAATSDGIVPTGKTNGNNPADSDESDDEWDLPVSNLSNTSDQSSSRLLFTNNSLFAFIRLVEMAMERLDKLHSLAISKAPKEEKQNVVASFLDLQTRERFPELGKDYYKSLLFLLKQLINGELDPAAFEEQARFMFGNDAYSVYTFDKLIQAIVKQAQTVLVDPTCEQLIRLFDSAKAPNKQKISEYSLRLAAENLLASSPRDSLVRIEYLPKTGRLGFQLLEKLFESAGGSVQARWSSYVDGFVKLDPNPAYLNPKSKVFLKRCLRHATAADALDGNSLFVDYNLECKICINTYKLFYVEHTEDTMARAHRPKEAVADDTGRLRRFNRWWNQEWEAIGNGPIEEATADFKRSFSLEQA